MGHFGTPFLTIFYRFYNLVLPLLHFLSWQKRDQFFFTFFRVFKTGTTMPARLFRLGTVVIWVNRYYALCLEIAYF